MKHPFFKKADIILAVVLLVIGALGLLAFRPAEAAGAYAVITVDGEELDRIDLSADQSRIIETSYGTNTVTIKDGCAFVAESDCRGGDCRDRNCRSGGSFTDQLQHPLNRRRRSNHI